MNLSSYGLTNHVSVATRLPLVFLGRPRKERKENLDGRFGLGMRVFGFLILHGWVMAFTSLLLLLLLLFFIQDSWHLDLKFQSICSGSGSKDQWTQFDSSACYSTGSATTPFSPAAQQHHAACRTFPGNCQISISVTPCSRPRRNQDHPTPVRAKV